MPAGDVTFRQELHTILEGKHPRLGKNVFFALNVVIFISCAGIALETMQAFSADIRDWMQVVERAVLIIFFLEYCARLYAAPDRWAYARSVWGIVDLLCWFPLIALAGTELAAIRALRLLSLLRMIKAMRGSRALERLEAALNRARGELIVFISLASITIYVGAVGIYTFEHAAQPDVFASIPESAWWALVSFTTVGYGDSYPITAEGRLFTSLILIMGLGVIAVPAAVITSALINTEPQHPSRKDHNDPYTLARRRPRVRGLRSLRHVRARRRSN
ncbi:MAG: ion transporter [Pseudomonadota bacterium]